MKKRRVKAGVKPGYGKPQGGLKSKFRKQTDGGSDSDFDDSDVNSDDFYHDEIDDFHAGQEKILLGGDRNFKANVRSGEEEVLPITDDEDDDLDEEEEEQDDGGDFGDEEDQHSLHKSDMESDLEDKSDDDLPNLDAWGKKKSIYYNADFVDKDWGKSYREEDEEQAKAEEMGALEMQTNFGASDVVSDIFDVGMLKVDKELPADEETPAMSRDGNAISKEGKLKLLKKDSPELFLLADDFKELMKELVERISPLYELVKAGRIQGSGAQYVTLKYNLILHYCMNISFYMMLKSRQQVSAKFHPVMKRASAYKKLLNQLEPLDEKLKCEIDIMLENLKNGEDLDFNAESVEMRSGEGVDFNVESMEMRNEEDMDLNVESVKMLSEPKEDDKKDKKAPVDRYAALTLPSLKRLIAEQMSEIPSKPKKQKVDLYETETEKEVSSLYMNMKKKQRDAKLLPRSDDDEEHQEEEKGNDEEDYDDSKEMEEYDYDDGVTDEKRTITYEIAKNKGLLPYRKKEYRNPRVRNRMKYRRAKIRRKGQVREPRKEITRYGGELTGIRTDVARSIKIK